MDFIILLIMFIILLLESWPLDIGSEPLDVGCEPLDIESMLLDISLGSLGCELWPDWARAKLRANATNRAKRITLEFILLTTTFYLTNNEIPSFLILRVFVLGICSCLVLVVWRSVLSGEAPVGAFI